MRLRWQTACSAACAGTIQPYQASASSGTLPPSTCAAARRELARPPQPHAACGACCHRDRLGREQQDAADHGNVCDAQLGAGRESLHLQGRRRPELDGLAAGPAVGQAQGQQAARGPPSAPQPCRGRAHGAAACLSLPEAPPWAGLAMSATEVTCSTRGPLSTLPSPSRSAGSAFSPN